MYIATSKIILETKSNTILSIYARQIKNEEMLNQIIEKYNL